MKHAVLALILAMSSVTALAQEESRGGMQRGPHGDLEQRLERMRSHLGLSDEQVTHMREIRASDATREEKREQMRGVLSEEQRDMMRQHRAQHGGKRHGPHDSKSTGADEQYN